MTVKYNDRIILGPLRPKASFQPYLVRFYAESGDAKLSFHSSVLPPPEPESGSSAVALKIITAENEFVQLCEVFIRTILYSEHQMRQKTKCELVTQSGTYDGGILLTTISLQHQKEWQKIWFKLYPKRNILGL